MNNKVKLSQASLVVSLAIILSLISSYVPMLSVLAILVSVLYAIIGTLTDRKYSILSIVITFLILMLLVSPVYSASICILSAIPGLLIGNIAKTSLKENEYNKFQPIYGGTIIFVVCNIAFFFIAKEIFGINLIDEFVSIMGEAIRSQMNIINDSNLGIVEGIRIEDIISEVGNMIPTVLFFQGMILSFIIYYLEAFILRKMKNIDLQIPKFKDFYLPGNAVVSSFMLYILILFMDLIELNLYTELIMVNLQLVFNFMFTIVGIAIIFSYISKFRKEGPNKNVLLASIMLLVTGLMGISFLGMLDSIIDFRKVRNYKST